MLYRRKEKKRWRCEGDDECAEGEDFEDADGVGEIMSLTTNCSFHLFIKGRETDGIRRAFGDAHPFFISYKSFLVLINFG